MEITPDEVVFWKRGLVCVNATLVYTWAVMGALTLGSWAVTRRFSPDRPSGRAQAFLEVLVSMTRDQIREITQQDPKPYLPFLGSLYLFVAVSNFLAFLPGYHPPTGSLSTTAALAAMVFLAVPAYSIRSRGVRGYLRHYVEPVVFMLPFHVISEVSRTVALAVRLFGNVMSGTLIIAILLSVAPLLFPVLLHALELLIGQVQAYIFAVLATVYIASAARTQGNAETDRTGEEPPGQREKEGANHNEGGQKGDERNG
jgi:F-type H+-transporting ATPase subunit a